MKYLFTLLLLVMVVAAQAQTRAQLTAKIKTPNALCWECQKRIETTLARYDGVLSVKVNFKRGETTVKYLTDRIDIEQIKTAIANMGYDADDVSANEDAYKRLPKSCKKPEDGGGHPVPKKKPVAEAVPQAEPAF